MSSPENFAAVARSYHRYPPVDGQILRGATAGAAAVRFDLATLAGLTANPASFRTFMVFKVFGADCYVCFSNVNTVVATAATSSFMKDGESQEWYAALVNRHRYMSIIRAAGTDVSWQASLSDILY